MVIYSNTKQGFLDDAPHIEGILERNVREKLGDQPSVGEIRSWHNSLQYMVQVIDDRDIPEDCGVALEYNIPVTNNRVDFIITGQDADGKPQVVMVELKQWQHVQATEMDGVVATKYEDGVKETAHPSYQVASYASLLYGFKEAVQNHDVILHPCAFLHNYEDDGIISGESYAPYIKKAPLFFKGDEGKLRDFIKSYVRKPDQNKSIYIIEDSKIVPSKSLVDSVVKMAEGKPEFRLIDQQKVAYQNILHAYEQYGKTGQKQVVIVKGGPGTGKSVIAVRLLIEMTRRKLLTHYVTKNAAPRNVFYKKFMETKSVDSSIKYLFKSSGIYYDKTCNEFDMLIVDEAHRLQEHSGVYGNLGENQIKEIIYAAKVSVFFIDEAQIVDFRDIGSIAQIEQWAKLENAQVNHQQLVAQMRCSGSDEYLRWIDHLLQYDNLLPFKLSGTTYDIQLVESPSELMKRIKESNRYRNKSRIVAGYCWEWESRENGKVKDIVFPDGFAYKWNLSSDKTWSISKGSVEQIGCIHTCQGLEFDYVGVIIGTDLLCRDGKILVQPNNRAKSDQSIRGWKTMMQQDPDGTKKKLKNIVLNTYRTLMTRGMKGCYLYVCDEELRDYIRKWIR